MPKFFVESNQIKNNSIMLFGEDVNHVANVLRKQVEDEINICNIVTSENFLCKIKEISKNQIRCDIIKHMKSEAEPNIELTVCQGLPKAEKMELIIQKCTELGAKHFIPVEMERCIVKLDNRTSLKKIERWKRVAETAAKQSGRDFIPDVENVINLQKLLNLIPKYDIVLLAYENEKNNTLKSILKKITIKDNMKIAIIIGPEGGLEPKEVEKLQNVGAKTITLGKRILRTETAGFAITSIIMYEFE